MSTATNSVISPDIREEVEAIFDSFGFDQGLLFGAICAALTISNTALADARAEVERVTKERDHSRKEVGLLLSSAAARGDEPDLLLGAWHDSGVRAEQAEEAFAICKEAKDAAEATIETLRAAGRQLANVAHNIHQRGVADRGSIQSLKAAQVGWDDALAAARALSQGGGNG